MNTATYRMNTHNKKPVPLNIESVPKTIESVPQIPNKWVCALFALKQTNSNIDRCFKVFRKIALFS